MTRMARPFAPRALLRFIATTGQSAPARRIGTFGLAGLPLPSRPGEFHPEALTEPCVTVSRHTARAIHRELPPSAKTRRFLLLPVDQVDHDANGLLPSLAGNYPASTLLRSSPPLISALVLSASEFIPLRFFP
jgi:hypothetical protein